MTAAAVKAGSAGRPICRQATVGTEQRYCYGVSLAPNGGELMQIIRDLDLGYLTGPHTKGLEGLTKEQALAAFEVTHPALAAAMQRVIDGLSQAGI